HDPYDYGGPILACPGRGSHAVVSASGAGRKMRGGAMRRKSLGLGVLATLIGLSLAAHALAFPQFARQTKLACVTCHTKPAGGADLKAAGKAFMADMTKAPAADTAKAAQYVGVNKCKMCHFKQYKAWQETKHASALESLQKADAKVSAEMA